MKLVIQVFNTVVAALFVVVPLASEAQPKTPAVHTVGVLAPQRMETYPSYSAFLETLRRLGYREDGNLRILLRSAEGKQDRLAALAAELVEARSGVIVAINTPGASAAIQATKRIPIVMAAVGDPVGSGFVTNLARPEGNVTGTSNLSAELAQKRMAVLKEIVPAAKRIAVMFNPEDPVTVPQVRDAERAAPKLKVEIRFFPVVATNELPNTFKQMLAWRADAALWLSGQNQGFQTGSSELAVRHRLPLMVGNRQNVEAGGLITYNADLDELFRRTAMQVDRILKGTKPGDLPVEQSTIFELAINLKTAKTLGLAVPQSVLLQATHVVK